MMPAHRVVQREVIAWANSLNGRPPVGDDISRLIAELAKAVEADRKQRWGDGIAECSDWNESAP
jgi:hypothetical protein